MQITENPVPGYERVVAADAPEAGYHALIAIHSTARGPAAGGTRFWNYRTREEAFQDVLRLARGMTYKNALAELPLGGGKAVITGDNATKDREKLFRAHGRFIDSLRGQFITGEDVGTSPADMEYVRQETTYVAGLHGRSGDPSPRTARGVFRAMQAAAKHCWGSESLGGKNCLHTRMRACRIFPCARVDHGRSQADRRGCRSGKSRACHFRFRRIFCCARENLFSSGRYFRSLCAWRHIEWSNHRSTESRCRLRAQPTISCSNQVTETIWRSVEFSTYRIMPLTPEELSAAAVWN